MLSRVKDLVQSKYLKNAIVLMGDSIIKLVIGFIISIFVARIFGPEKFGQINYVAAVISFLQVFIIFGFDTIVRKDLGLETYPENTVVKTVILLRWGLALIAYSLGFFLFYFYLGKTYIYIYLILGLELFCYIYDVYKQWFQIKSLNKYVVFASQIAFFSLIALKIIYLCFFDNLNIYSACILFSFFIEVVVLRFIFHRLKDNSPLRFDRNYAKELVKASLPLLLNNFTIVIYMKVDQVMIGKMLTAKEVGLYSVAVTISEMVYFFPMAISNALYPKITDAKKNGEDYKKILERIGQINVTVCLLWALFCTFLMPFLVVFVYGENYAPACTVIQIHSWAGIFVGASTGTGSDIIFEEKQKLFFYDTMFAAVLNVILNYILIKIIGINGAAIATLFAQAFSAWLFFVFLKDKKYFKLRCRFYLIYNLVRKK